MSVRPRKQSYLFKNFGLLERKTEKRREKEREKMQNVSKNVFPSNIQPKNV